MHPQGNKQKHTTEDPANNALVNILWDVRQYSWVGFIWTCGLLVNKFTKCSIEGLGKQALPSREYWQTPFPPLLCDQYVHYTKSVVDVNNSKVIIIIHTE